MNLHVRQITAADRQTAMPSLDGYWGIFEGDRVAAISRVPSELFDIVADVYGLAAAAQMLNEFMAAERSAA